MPIYIYIFIFSFLLFSVRSCHYRLFCLPRLVDTKDKEDLLVPGFAILDGLMVNLLSWMERFFLQLCFLSTTLKDIVLTIEVRFI